MKEHKMNPILIGIVIVEFIIIIALKDKLNDVTDSNLINTDYNTDYSDSNSLESDYYTKSPFEYSFDPEACKSSFNTDYIDDEYDDYYDDNDYNENYEEEQQTRYVLTQGSYYCTSDIPAGTYNIECIEGFSTITKTRSGQDYVEYFNADRDIERTYKNYDVISGDRLKINSGCKLVFKLVK